MKAVGFDFWFCLKTSIQDLKGFKIYRGVIEIKKGVIGFDNSFFNYYKDSFAGEIDTEKNT
jgi:hypothetical protein